MKKKTTKRQRRQLAEVAFHAQTAGEILSDIGVPGAGAGLVPPTLLAAAEHLQAANNALADAERVVGGFGEVKEEEE